MIIRKTAKKYWSRPNGEIGEVPKIIGDFLGSSTVRGEISAVDRRAEQDLAMGPRDRKISTGSKQTEAVRLPRRGSAGEFEKCIQPKDRKNARTS